MLEAVRLKAVGRATRPAGATMGVRETSVWLESKISFHEVERGQRQKALHDQ